MRLRVLLIVASVMLLGFAPAPFPKRDRQREDPTDVNGTWEFVLWESSGTRQQSTEGMYHIEMKRDEYAFVGKNGGGHTFYNMKLDPGASPSAFTWSRNNNVMFVGSYRLHKDEMTMIFASGNDLARRPTDFTAKRVEYRFVMRRIRRN
jgi:uncharacterized protein (TIGR03067 family)